jgi:predicted transcriptional regulator
MKPKDMAKRSVDLNPSEELELLRDVKRGISDIEAGRVVTHEEALARLLARYKKS